MDTWIVKMVRAASLHRIVAWGLALVLGVLAVAGQRRYINNFLRGPFELRAAELDAIDDVVTTPRYFARVSGSKVIDTGLREYSVRTSAGVETGRSESGRYHALVLGNRFLIVKTGGDVSSLAEGELAPMPAQLEEQLFDSKEMQQLRPRFYRFYMSNDPFRLPGYIVIVVALAFAALFAWKAIPAWKHFRDPATHPLMTRMGAWGDPLGVAVEAERDAHSPHHKGGGWALGSKYLVRTSFFTFDVLRMQDLLWAYKKVTKHSVNFIPTGKTHEAILVCYGGSATIKAKEKAVDEVLAFTAQRVPWAVFGYTAELAAVLRKTPQDFAGAVEQRRQEWQEKKGQQSRG